MLISTILLSLGVAQAADTTQVRYTLAVDGEPVGFRELEVKYLLSEAGDEVRILESWTELTVTVAGTPFSYQQRLAGRGGDGGFASVVNENGVNREIQAVHTPGGWIVTVAEGGQAKVYNMAPTDFDLTSLLLVDPGATRGLDGRSQLQVLTAETGQVIGGTLATRGEVLVPVGDRTLKGTEYIWSLPEGEVRMAWGEKGHLLRYTMRVAGRNVTATLDAPPPERSWGSAMETPLIPTAPTLKEDEL
ncbi:MAG: hypothetical protein H6739_39485 [Alphaproteobacteria bacterium]|nr:hypothetical protein [Alphaproteobacteria bacterium]